MFLTTMALFAIIIVLALIAIFGKVAAVIITLLFVGFALGFIVATRLGTVIHQRVLNEIKEFHTVIKELPIKGTEAERELLDKLRQALAELKRRLFAHLGHKE
jgi:flagellar motor component MotA